MLIAHDLPVTVVNILVYQFMLTMLCHLSTMQSISNAATCSTNNLRALKRFW